MMLEENKKFWLADDEEDTWGDDEDVEDMDGFGEDEEDIDDEDMDFEDEDDNEDLSGQEMA